MGDTAKTVDLTEGYEVDLGADQAAKIFPQSYADAFNVSKEEKADLWENIKNDYRNDGIFDKYFNIAKALERGEKYQEQLTNIKQLFQEAIQLLWHTRFAN